MLTPKEKMRLLQLQEKDKLEAHVPLTDTEVKEFYDRAEMYSGQPIAQLHSFTNFLGELTKPIQQVVADNVRLLQELEYYKQRDSNAKAAIVPVPLAAPSAGQGSGE